MRVRGKEKEQEEKNKRGEKVGRERSGEGGKRIKRERVKGERG